MSVTSPTTEFTARKRPRRARSRAVSDLPAIAVSKMMAHEYDLRPACISLVCPSCRTWVPINKPGTPKPKLVPHHMQKAGSQTPTRCPGSHRLVILDMDIERWWQRLEEGVAETDGRHGNRTVHEERLEDQEQGLWLLRELQWASTATAVQQADIQRVQDQLEATLLQYRPTLDEWERADLMGSITMLATRAAQLSR